MSKSSSSLNINEVRDTSGNPQEDTNIGAAATAIIKSYSPTYYIPGTPFVFSTEEKYDCNWPHDTEVVGPDKDERYYRNKAVKKAVKRKILAKYRQQSQKPIKVKAKK